MQTIPAQPNSSPNDGNIISVCASGMDLANPCPAPCPDTPPLLIAQMPLATWSPPNTSLFQALSQMALRSISLFIGPGKSEASRGILSSNINPHTMAVAITADSLRFFLRMSIYSNRQPMVIAVASHTLSEIQMARIYKITAAAISLKSPREKEKRMMNVKQQTMAGPRSPKIKNNKMVAPIEISANKKKEKRLLHVVYSEMNFSLAAKKPARKMMTINLTISLG